MIKCLPVLWLWLALPSFAPAQDATTSHDHNSPLRIVGIGWTRFRPSRLSLETGMPQAASSPGERLSEVSLQRQIAAQQKHPSQDKESVKKLEERQVRQQRRLPETGGARPSSARPSQLRGGGYRYTVELQNLTQRKVRVVEWDYVFVEPSTGKELRRYRFTSKAEIGAGKQKKLTEESEEAPYGVVEVKGLSGEQAGERAEIKRVEYTDGTAWEN